MRRPGTSGSFPSPRSRSTSHRSGVHARGRRPERSRTCGASPSTAARPTNAPPSVASRTRTIGDRLAGRELRQCRTRLPVEDAPRLVAARRDAEPRRAHGARGRGEALDVLRHARGPSRPWRRRGSRPARRQPRRCRAPPRARRRSVAGGAGTRARRRTSRCALPRPSGPAAAVGARLLAPAADLHGAPARRAVSRDVVEQPAARVLPAGLEPVPGSRRARRRHDGDDRGQPPGRAAARRRDAGPVAADPDDEGERAERGVDRRAALPGRRARRPCSRGRARAVLRGAREPPRTPRRPRRRRRGSAPARGATPRARPAWRCRRGASRAPRCSRSPGRGRAARARGRGRPAGGSPP